MICSADFRRNGEGKITIFIDNSEEKMRFISILCLARQRVQSKATLAMIDDLLKEIGTDER